MWTNLGSCLVGGNGLQILAPYDTYSSILDQFNSNKYVFLNETLSP